MKVAVVGCGAVGSFYGAQLCRAGHEVHFLLRSDFDMVRRKGVFIRSPQGHFHVQPKAACAPAEIGPSDLVLIGLKTTANDQLPHLLPPLLGPKSAVLTLQNGLGNEEQLAQLCPTEQILGGLCFVCLNRVAPGMIHHIDHGQIVLGEFQRWPEPRTHDIAALFRHAGVPCDVTANLERSHWEKLTWNVPFNGLGVASMAGFEAVMSGRCSPATPPGPCLTTDRLLGDPHWERLVRALMQEVIAAAGALGLAIPDAVAEKQMARTRTMGAYKPSTLIDFERGQPLELESLFLEPLRRGTGAGVALPRLQALSEVLRQLQRP
jgi:2-dehydropantoate 2-reductase